MQLRRYVFALLVVGCVPDGGVRFDAPVSEGGPETGAGDPGTTSGATTGGLPPTPPPPATTAVTTMMPTTTTTDGDDTGEAPVSGTLVPARATWRYRTTAPAGDWTAPGHDDAAWLEGAAPFGDAGDIATAVDPASAPVGVWLRRRFVGGPGPAHLMLYLRRGDGAAVYLNGEELARSNLPAGALAPDTLAEDDLGGAEVERYLRFVAPATALRSGDNVVAVTLRRAKPGQVGLTFDLQLDAFALADAPTDALTLQWRTRSYGGEYADKNVGAAWIERAGGGFVRTLVLWADVRRDHLVRWQSAGGVETDAVTSATRGSHRTSEAAWDLRDAQGQLAPPGAYRLLIEFTEENSNKSDPPGPLLDVPFTLGGPSLPVAPAHPRFRDVLVLAP